MVEKFDFASGTSSRSTKLIHGGVRYLQKAIMGFDIEQVRCALRVCTREAYVSWMCDRCVRCVYMCVCVQNLCERRVVCARDA